MKKGLALLFLGFCIVHTTVAQGIPYGEVLSNSELSNYLNDTVKNKLQQNGSIDDATLAAYFRSAFKERYFYNWETAESRFKDYAQRYPEAKAYHTARALDHLEKFPSQVQWKLPFNYKNGEPVDAYALRHLARQHKMVDIGYYYFYQNKDEASLNYFTEQMASLNSALSEGKYETIADGNGIYEAFRSGYRILNWLHLHNLFLGQPGYSDAEQLTTIATLLQHAQHLYQQNQEFQSGNHQTRGLSALAMVAILLRDFKGADQWYQHAMKLLKMHLEREINPDGFQFERTIHYHISDIGTYFYVYQLAKKSGVDIDPEWENKLKSLFTTLTKVAYPDKSAPVFSDDTDAPWAEKNDISGAMTLGYLLFEAPEMGHFASDKLSTKFYWTASEKQLKTLEQIASRAPKYPSLAFKDTGYYIMRQGWDKNDQMLVISAGLDPDKPDHQHGDMLGVQAMANAQVILPNYQVRYSLKDLELFKNSMTKNVALVDDQLQGKNYTSNKGGSGFGKFKNLPHPKTIAFETSSDLDVFIGSHDGFENLGVTYSRQVIFIKDAGFWIVKDNFNAEDSHDYKQVWQGHYSLEESPDLLRSTFEDGSGLDILQLHKTDTVGSHGKRGKQWQVVTKSGSKDFQFITVLFPFETYDARIDEASQAKNLNGWVINDSRWETDNPESISMSKENVSIFFNVKQLKSGATKIEFDQVLDVLLKVEDNNFEIIPLSNKKASAKVFKNGLVQIVKLRIADLNKNKE